MREHRDDLARLDAATYVVSFERPQLLNGYLKRYGVPFPGLSDPERVAYNAFGMGRGSWLRLANPAVVAHYVRGMLAGQTYVRPRGDTQQLGGDVIIDAAGRVRLAHVGQDQLDRPSVERLLQELRAAGGDAATTPSIRQEAQKRDAQS